MSSRYLLPLTFWMALAPCLHAADPAATPKPETPAEYEARIHWLREACFGMFIHWGVYAATSGEWKGRYYDSGGEWIERIANTPIADYKALGKDFSYQEGALTGAITLAQPGPDAFLTDWTDPGWFVESHVKTPAAGRWAVSAEFAANAPAKLTLTARDIKAPFDVMPTSGKFAWKTLEIGALDLPASESTIQLKPVGKNWAGGLNLRRL